MKKKFEHFIGMRNIFYSGIILDSESQNKLLNKFNIPNGWIRYAHHMTICLGELPTIYREYRDEKIKLIVTHYIFTDNLISVKVDGFFALSRNGKNETSNRIPHITVATKPGTKPKESNKIEEWLKIKPFFLNGTVKEINAEPK